MCVEQPISMVVIMQNTQEKADSQKTKVPKHQENKKGHADRNKLRNGKEWRPYAQQLRR